MASKKQQINRKEVNQPEILISVTRKRVNILQNIAQPSLFRDRRIKMKQNKHFAKAPYGAVGRFEYSVALNERLLLY